MAAIRWAYNPPILQGISGAGAWPKSVSEMTNILRALVSNGYNLASVNWRPPREWGEQQYRDVVRAAEQAGIQLMPWMGWGASSISQVIGWIGGSPAIWGWYSHDEPTTGGASVEGQEGVYNALKQYDPQRRPVVSSFTPGAWQAWAPHTFDIAAMQIYPFAIAPEKKAPFNEPQAYLIEWANHYASVFGEAGKQVIPMLQGMQWGAQGLPPDLLSEWQWWNASRMPLYPASYAVFGGEVHSQARELARLLSGGLPPPPPPTPYIDTTCPRCESLLRVHQ